MQTPKGISSRVPPGIWPTLFILAFTSALIGGLFGVGYLSLHRLTANGEFLPTHRVPWFAESIIAYDMSYAVNTEEQNDVLITGGSASLAGLVTKSYQDATGKRAYNFGSAIDIGPDGHFEFIRRYLLNHHHPEAIIYIATARDVGDVSTYDVETRNRFTRAYAPSIPEESMSLADAGKLYLVEGKLAIERLVRSGGKHPFDAPRGRRPSHSALEASLTIERGFQEYPQYPQIRATYLEELDQFVVSDWYSESFRDMARASQDLGIPFTIYFTPIPKNTFDVDNGPLITWAEGFEDEFPGAEVRGLPLVQYDLDMWGNGYHLNRQGAERFTAEVANSLESTINKAEGK